MRSLISLSIAGLLALGLAAGGVAGQTRKSTAKTRTTRRTAQAGGKAKSGAGSQAAAAAPAPTPSPAAPAIETPADGVRRITPAEARAAVEQGRAIIVDVRSEDSYKAGHIRGSRWISLNDIESRTAELPRDKMIITYCS
jgi:hypothetical protein